MTHDLEDHGWQFLGLEDVRFEDAAVVSLSEIVERDPTVQEVADLPPGWHAWREAVGAKWMRARNPRHDDDDLESPPYSDR